MPMCPANASNGRYSVKADLAGRRLSDDTYRLARINGSDGSGEGAMGSV
jgi:hypothetical protein